MYNDTHKNTRFVGLWKCATTDSYTVFFICEELGAERFPGHKLELKAGSWGKSTRTYSDLQLGPNLPKTCTFMDFELGLESARTYTPFRAGS